MQEESFGPLLPVRAVEDDDEALRQMNDTRYGLTASVWTRDRGRADAVTDTRGDASTDARAADHAAGRRPCDGPPKSDHHARFVTIR